MERCKTCRYWEQDDRYNQDAQSNEYGTCHKAEYHRPAGSRKQKPREDPITVSDCEGCGAFLITREDFGCTEHKTLSDEQREAVHREMRNDDWGPAWWRALENLGLD